MDIVRTSGGQLPPHNTVRNPSHRVYLINTYSPLAIRPSALPLYPPTGPSRAQQEEMGMEKLIYPRATSDVKVPTQAKGLIRFYFARSWHLFTHLPPTTSCFHIMDNGPPLRGVSCPVQTPSHTVDEVPSPTISPSGHSITSTRKVCKKDGRRIGLKTNWRRKVIQLISIHYHHPLQLSR